jgi:hypothetical protein
MNSSPQLVHNGSVYWGNCAPATARDGPAILRVEAVTIFSSFRFSELSQSICSSPLLRFSGKSVAKCLRPQSCKRFNDSTA